MKMRGLFRRLSVSLYREYRCERPNKWDKKSERMNQGWPRGSRGEKQQGRKYLNSRYKEANRRLKFRFRISDSREWEAGEEGSDVSRVYQKMLFTSTECQKR